MLDRLLPRHVDNTFQGQKPALWLFAAILLLLAAMSLNSALNGRFVATQADGLPLDAYTQAGARVVVSFYAIWGVTQLMLIAIGTLMLLRYRALVALMFLLLLFEQALLQAVHHYLPIARPHGMPAAWFVYLLQSMMAIGLVLALWKRNHGDEFHQRRIIPTPRTSPTTAATDSSVSQAQGIPGARGNAPDLV